MTSPLDHRPFRFRRALIVAAPPDHVWAVLAAVEDYPDWWSWLRLDGAPGPLAEGLRVRVTIRPPLPYALHLTIRTDTVDPPHRIAATVSGDLEGTGTIVIEPHPGGARAVIGWDLRPRRRLLRALAICGRPLLSGGHDWVIRTGAIEFERATGLGVGWEPADGPAGRPWVPVLAGAAAAGATIAITLRRRRG